MLCRRLRPQLGADRAGSVFLLQAGWPRTNPSSFSSLISRFCFPPKKGRKFRLSPAELWQIMLFVPTHTWCLQKYFQGSVWEVCLARGMKEPIIIIIELFRAVWSKKKGGGEWGEFFRELTKGGGFNPNIADPQGNYRGTLCNTKGVRVGKWAGKIRLSASKYDKSLLLRPFAVNYSSVDIVSAHFDGGYDFDSSKSSRANNATCSRVWEHVQGRGCGGGGGRGGSHSFAEAVNAPWSDRQVFRGGWGMFFQGWTSSALFPGVIRFLSHSMT